MAGRRCPARRPMYCTQLSHARPAQPAAGMRSQLPDCSPCSAGWAWNEVSSNRQQRGPNSVQATLGWLGVCARLPAPPSGPAASSWAPPRTRALAGPRPKSARASAPGERRARAEVGGRAARQAAAAPRAGGGGLARPGRQPRPGAPSLTPCAAHPASLRTFEPELDDIALACAGLCPGGWRRALARSAAGPQATVGCLDSR